MAIKFAAFSMWQTRKVKNWKLSWRGVPYEQEETVPAYATTHELYAAVAAFADSVGGRLVAITGTPSISTETRHDGEVVVYYRE